MLEKGGGGGSQLLSYNGLALSGENTLWGQVALGKRTEAVLPSNWSLGLGRGPLRAKHLLMEPKLPP